MKIKRLVLGTRNPGKLAEWQTILIDVLPITINSVAEFGEVVDPIETGTTFEENARQKASDYAQQIGEYVWADDGGYEIEILGGWPGVKSRRILPGDKEGTDQDLIDSVLKRLTDVPEYKRGVKLTVAVALANADGKIIYEDKESFGGLVTQTVGPVIIPGYPFRSIHWIPELKKTYAELTEAEHRQYSHKRRIAGRLREFLVKY